VDRLASTTSILYEAIAYVMFFSKTFIDWVNLKPWL